LFWVTPDPAEEKKKKKKKKKWRKEKFIKKYVKLPTFWHLRYYLKSMPISAHS